MGRIGIIGTLVVFFALSFFSYVYPTDAIGDGGRFEVNVEYLKNSRFLSDQKLLELRVVMLTRTPRKIRFYSAPKSSETVNCTFGQNMTLQALDCGLVPMSMFLYVEYTYVFKVLKQEGEWLQLSAPFAAAESLWLHKSEYPDISKDPSAEIAVQVKPLSEWVMYLYGFGIVDGVVSNRTYIRMNPEEKGKILDSCKSAEPYNGGLMKTRGETEKTRQGEIRGDWVKVFCDSTDCFDEDSPEFLSSDYVPALARLKEERKKMKSCVRGWARWRSTDGHVLLYPSYSVSR